MNRVLIATGLGGLSAIIAAGLLGFLVGGRYSMSDHGSYPVRLDRFTGEATVCLKDRCTTFMPAGPVQPQELSEAEVFGPQR